MFSKQITRESLEPRFVLERDWGESNPVLAAQSTWRLAGGGGLTGTENDSNWAQKLSLLKPETWKRKVRGVELSVSQFFSLDDVYSLGSSRKNRKYCNNEPKVFFLCALKLLLFYWLILYRLDEEVNFSEIINIAQIIFWQFIRDSHLVWCDR